MHRREVAKAAFNDLADRMIIPRKDIRTVLRDWSPEQLREHLCKHTEAQLTEPARRRFRR